MVESQPSKLLVAGSIPVSRSSSTARKPAGVPGQLLVEARTGAHEPVGREVAQLGPRHLDAALAGPEHPEQQHAQERVRREELADALGTANQPSVVQPPGGVTDPVSPGAIFSLRNS